MAYRITADDVIELFARWRFPPPFGCAPQVSSWEDTYTHKPKLAAQDGRGRGLREVSAAADACGWGWTQGPRPARGAGENSGGALQEGDSPQPRPAVDADVSGVGGSIRAGLLLPDGGCPSSCFFPCPSSLCLHQVLCHRCSGARCLCHSLSFSALYLILPRSSYGVTSSASFFVAFSFTCLSWSGSHLATLFPNLNFTQRGSNHVALALRLTCTAYRSR